MPQSALLAHDLVRTLGARRVLAALLVRRPATLLLDEPTNHLDDDAAAFLHGEPQLEP